MKKKTLLSNSLLLLTSIIWGTSFVAQRVGMEHIGPLTFNTARFILSAIFLIAILVIKKITLNKNQIQPLILGSLFCGLSIFFAACFQQKGLVLTSAGKGAFITALYILLVPIGGLFLGHRLYIQDWIGVVLGTIGLYLLCITERFTIGTGDILVLISSFFWAVHVFLIDNYIKKNIPPVWLSLGQTVVACMLSIVLMLFTEEPRWSLLWEARIPLLYAGILSGGIGFTFQMVAQKYTSPMVTSLILSMEAVFAAVAGFFILNEHMTRREIVGSSLLMISIILSQLPLNMSVQYSKSKTIQEKYRNNF